MRDAWPRAAQWAGLGLAALAVAVIAAPWLSPYDPDAAVMGQSLLRPSTTHWLGTDGLGRDVLSRLLHGGRISLLVGAGTAVLAGGFGTAVGVLSAVGPRWLDTALSWVIDGTLALPGLLVLLAVMGLFRPGPDVAVPLLVLLLAGLSWPSTARLVRSEASRVRQRGFVVAAQALGLPRWKWALHHVLPHSLGPVWVALPLAMGRAMLTEATLSFLTLGVQPPTASWGVMVADGRAEVVHAPWLVFAPSLAIAATVTGLHLLGQAIGDRVQDGATLVPPPG